MNGNSAAIAIAIFLFAIIPLVIILVSINKANEKKRLEKARQIMEADRRRAAQEAAKAKEEEKLRREEELRQKINDICVRFIEFDTDMTWISIDHYEYDQYNRVRRAYEERDRIKLIAYDQRMKLAKIRGTSYNLYLTGPNFCTCGDFRFRKLPCKHMYFLSNALADEDNLPSELDYEHGLFGYETFLIGRFSQGKEKAIRQLQERGCIVNSNQLFNTTFAVIGKSNAVVSIYELNEKAIPIIKFSDALRLFTSEIRYPEIMEDQ